MSRYIYYNQERERDCQVQVIIGCELAPIKVKIVAEYEVFNLVEWVDSLGRIYFRELIQNKRALQ